MKNKVFAISIFGIIFLSFIIFFVVRGGAGNEKEYGLEKCKTLNYNSKKAMGIVFMSSKEEAVKNMNFFLNTYPYNNYKKGFNFYYIDDYSPNCTLYKGIALFCNSKELIKKAGSCDYDYIAVVQNANQQIRSSAYMNVMSINSKHPLTTFVHEIGHSLANLDDEYVPASLSTRTVNCFKDCNKFGSESCYSGCGDNEHYRSIEKGVMKTLSSSEYGDFNSQIIEKVLNEEYGIQITGQAVYEEGECANKKYFLLVGKIKDGRMIITDKELYRGCVPDGINGLDYNYTAGGNSGSMSDIIHYDVQFEEEINGGSESTNEFYITIPADDESISLEVEDMNGNTLLSNFILEDLNNIACRI